MRKSRVNCYYFAEFKDTLVDPLFQKFVDSDLVKVEKFYATKEDLPALEAEGKGIASPTFSHAVFSKLTN